MKFVISGAFNELPDLHEVAVAADACRYEALALPYHGLTASLDVKLDGLRRFADDSIGGQR